MLAVKDGDLYAGGDFTTAGALSSNRIAKWNGSAWAALGSGMNSRVSALAVIGSDLYAGGGFTTADGVSANRIAKWNGSNWVSLGSGINLAIYALVASGSDLYVGGDFTTAGGVSANRVAKWNGSTWAALGSGMSGRVFAMATDSFNRLFVGGNFGMAGTTVSPFIAQANLGPEISVEQPFGTGLISGSESIAFGVVTVGGSSSAKSFTIRNTGTGALALNNVSVTGSNPGSFIVNTGGMLSSVPAGGSTTFSATFVPSSAGPQSTTLNIASDDPDENPFTITLTGTGNTSPTFAGYSVATAWQTAASISLSKLLTKAADADGDTLSVTASGPASTQNGTAVLQSGSILYTPPAAFSGSDTFSVTISDAYGATVSGTVMVSVGPNPTSGGQGVNPPQITMLGNGDAEIGSQGIPGRTYLVQRSTNLSFWATIGTITAASNGAVSFIDPSPPQPSAFYRLGRNVPEMNFWGNGSDGALTTSGNISFGSVQDGDVVVKQFTNFTINAGHTVTTSNRCRGLVIYVNGDCTINGTLR